MPSSYYDTIFKPIKIMNHLELSNNAQLYTLAELPTPSGSWIIIYQ